jgi:predicted DNA-binding protein
MTITIRLSDKELRRLAERAARSGRDLADYVHLLIKRDIQQMAGWNRPSLRSVAGSKRAA